MGLLCANQNVGNIPTNALSGILGLLCAEQNVGNINEYTFKNSGTPVRRATRRKSQTLHFQEFWDSCAQNKTSEISKKHFQDFWDSCAQNKKSEISKNVHSRNLGLQCAEQNIGNIKKCTFRHSGTPVRRTKRQTSQNMHCHIVGDSCAQNKTSDISRNALSGIVDSCAQSKTSEI